MTLKPRIAISCSTDSGFDARILSRLAVADQGSGLLFEPGDAAELAGHLDRPLGDPDLRKRLQLDSRERFERLFSWDAVFEKFYRPLLTKRRVEVPR